MNHHCIQKIFFSFLFLCMLQPIYAMENENKGFFSHLFNIHSSYTLYFQFRNAVELARKNGFSIEDCEIIKDYIIKGANPNWKIGEDEEALLSLVVMYQKKDLFDFLLQHHADINASNKNMRTPLHILAFTGNKRNEIQISDLLQHKANIQAIDDTAATPLQKAVSSSNIHAIKSLIKYGADINEVYNDGCAKFTPLVFAICTSKKPGLIIELCKLRASLTNTIAGNNNIFHVLTYDKRLIKYIKPIITHARFDGFDKGSKKIVPFVLWLLKHWEENNRIKLPKEIKLHILSKLPLSDLYPYKKLCEALLKGNHNHILLPQIRQGVENIKQILVTPNDKNQTALQHALEKFANDQEHISRITPLLGSKLQNDYDNFIANFPAILNSEKEEDKDNLANQMFYNCAELFLE